MLNNKLLAALAKIYHLYVNKERVLAKEDQIREARRSAHTRLVCLEKVHEKVQLKEFRLVEQGLYELESKEKGFSLKDPETVLHSPVVGSLLALGSPLANLFFNPSFSLLPNLISSNTP